MLPAAASSPPTGGLRALSATLVAGAVYDFVLAVVMLTVPGLLALGLALPLPGQAFYLRLLAVLLIMAGAMYWVAAADPRSFRALVLIAIIGRFLGFAGLALSTIGHPELAGLWVVALGDLLFALLHLATGRALVVR